MGRRTFTAAFRRESAYLVLRRGISIGQAAKNQRLNENVPCKWVKGATANGAAASLGRGRQGGRMMPKWLSFDVSSPRRRPSETFQRSRCLLRERTAATFAFIPKHRELWQARQMCETFGVSRGGL